MGNPRMRFDGVDPDLDEQDFGFRKNNRERSRQNNHGKQRSGTTSNAVRWTRKRTRSADGNESFRCRHCKTMVGPTLSGGRHRNHCPVCLYSRHVDGPTPGDRASECRSLMAPVGLLTRRSGEQVILHRCLGCGFERRNRVAADDHPLVLMRLPLVAIGNPAEIVDIAASSA